MSAPRGKIEPAVLRLVPRELRDQDETAFTPILADLVSWIRGARAAALVDMDGETVDYAGAWNPFAIRLAAAHLRIVLREVREAIVSRGDTAAGATLTLSLRTSQRAFAVHSLPQGYALVLMLSAGAGLAVHPRAISVCVRRLAAEAGWSGPREVEAPVGARPTNWFPVTVECDRDRRPVAVRSEGARLPCHVLGIVASGLTSLELGWRVRCGSAEATLVREPGGQWFADEALEL